MAEILITDITESKLNGNGVFDKLMHTLTVHLDEEFSKNRLRGTDYSSVYLGGMTAMLEQSIGFLLNKQKADKEAELLDAQRLKVLSDIAKVDQEALLIAAQIRKIDAEILLIGDQILLLRAQVEAAQFEKDKILAEISLLEQQVINAQAELNNLLKLQAKLEAEAALIKQKVFTEQAEIIDIVNGSSVVGLVGVQKKLHVAQATSFVRDAEQKLARIMADSWSIRRSTDEGENPLGSGLTNIEIQKVINKAIEGIEA